MLRSPRFRLSARSAPRDPARLLWKTLEESASLSKRISMEDWTTCRRRGEGSVGVGNSSIPVM